MTLVELLRAYPGDPGAIMSKRLVNEVANYIEELEKRVKILEEENDRIRISSTSGNSES